MKSTYSLLNSLAMAERSESEVSAAIMEARRKFGYELRERQQEIVAKFVRGRDFFVLLPTSLDF